MLCKRPDVFLFGFESAWEGRMMLHSINTYKLYNFLAECFMNLC